MEELKLHTEALLSSSPAPNSNVQHLYPLLSTVRITQEQRREVKTVVIPDVYTLIKKHILHKDLIYLSLLINRDPGVLEIFLEYECELPLDFKSSTSLFIQAYKHKRYWLESVLLQNVSPDVFSDEINRNIRLVQLLHITNIEEIDLDAIRSLLSTDLEHEDDFVKLYVGEIRYILQIIEFMNLHHTPTELFNYINGNSLLQVFNEYLDLNDTGRWDLISEKLSEDVLRKSSYEYNSEEIANYSDLEVFKTFTIMHDVIECIKSRNGGEVMQRNEIKFSELNDEELQVELLECIFSLCFIRWEHFSFNQSKKAGGFLCTSQELRMVLVFLKACMDKLRGSSSPKLKPLSRYVSEGLWRLELVEGVTEVGEEKEFLSCMLANPESLICMCLKKGRFDRALEVIQIFNLEETDLAKNIIYTDSLNNLRASLMKSFKLKDYQKNLPSLPSNQPSSEKIIQDFFTNRKFDDDETFCDILDVALVSNENYVNTKEILKLANAHFTGDYPENYLKFYTNLTDLFEKSERLSIGEILLEPKHELTYEKDTIKEGFYKDLQTLLQAFNTGLQLKPAGAFTGKHPAHEAFTKLNLLLGNTAPKYLQRFFNYLQLLFKLFQIEGNNVDLIARGKTVSYFEILKHARSSIFRKLIYERGLDPRDFTEVCAKLKIDCLYHTSSNCFPKIQLQTENEHNVSPLLPPGKTVFTYITRSNWLLAYVIKEIFSLEELVMDVSENRTKYLTQYMNSDVINRLKILFNNNKIITGLHNGYFTRCMDYINKNVFHEQFELSNDSFEAGTEIIEEDCSCNWRYLLELVESVPEQQLQKEQQRVDKMRDRILSNLVLDSYELNHYKYVQFIKDDGLRLDVIFEHFSSWPGAFCVTLLNMELAHPEASCRSVLQDWLKVIEFCEEVVQLCDFKIWFDVHEMCCENQEEMMQKLLCNPKVNLLLNFIDLYKPDEELLSSSINQECIAALLKNDEHLERVEALVTKLPDPLIIAISKNLLLALRNIEHIQFLIDYLMKINHETLFLKNIQLSLNMLELFNAAEREPLWCLLSKPMHIVETLVMNTKLDKFGAIMEILRPELETCELDDEDISVESVDELLRRYAEKSLEFRVIVEPHPKLLQCSDNKLMQSLDSLYGPDRKCFVMPPTVPDRVEWVPNNEVVECMCCQNTVFSMFNRRHHCRRCGRIICFNCSTRRMHVPTYGSILVRVCIDCYDQSHADGNTSACSDNASNKSIIYDFWLLTDDEEQNVIVRREFSYEHAPSVSLCLSIMKHHSKNMHYARFLLDQCDNMLRLLQPVAPNGPHEVDYSLVVKMMKSLAIAAKMLSSECHLQWGASQADRILSQADLLGLLAERGGLNLLANDSPYVDRRVLRRLRDNLLEREQWNFALDVSTKAGLDNAGVFAAWGKSYLKAGCLQLAREKFHRCLDKSPHYDTSDYSLDDSFESTSRKRHSSRASSILDSKPSKNPPLLNQIIQILESQTVKFDHRTKKDLFNIKLKSQPGVKVKDPDPAICIKSKLKNLKAVAAGNYDQLESVNNRLDPLFFDECVYYLGKYGTHASLLEFYIRHGCLGDALSYMIDNRVSAEVFIEVYVGCLNEGKVNEFQEGMASVDSTLDVWKDHLKQICRYLEKQGLLNSLYQLQQFMGDYVRAAMTCIRFYKDNVTCYRELLSNVHFLHKAEDHMKQDLEQQEWVHTVRRMSSDSRNSCFEEKALTNPSLVMRMNSRDVEKHIYTIRRQIEVTKFLAKVEKDDKHLFGLLPSITPSMNEDVKECVVTHMPTLFDSQHEKVQLTVLIIICAENFADGYQLAHQIIQEHKLKAIKVFCQTGRLLANDGRYEAVAQLVNCICSSGVADSSITDMCDELLAAAIRATDTPTPSTEALVKLITDKAMKISMYIEMKQLKSACLLAAKYSRFGDIRRILREAELINKPDIKKLCQKLLQAHSHSHI